MSSAQRVFHGQFGRVALLEMDRSLVTHTHAECHLLLKVAGGDTYFNVNRQRVPLTDRTAILVNAWEPHFYDYQEGAEPTLILALYIDPAWLASAQRSLALSAHPSFFKQPCIDLNSKTRSMADRLIAQACGAGLVPRERIEFLLFDFLIEVIENFSHWRHLWRTGAADQCQDARIRKGKEYLISHLDDPDCLANAIKASTLSRAQFFSLFHKHAGATPALVLNAARMQRAFAWLGQERTGTLGLLSERLGFSEQGHFTRFFRQHIGASPSQYQRSLDCYES